MCVCVLWSRSVSCFLSLINLLILFYLIICFCTSAILHTIFMTEVNGYKIQDTIAWPSQRTSLSDSDVIPIIINMIRTSNVKDDIAPGGYTTLRARCRQLLDDPWWCGGQRPDHNSSHLDRRFEVSSADWINRSVIVRASTVPNNFRSAILRTALLLVSYELENIITTRHIRVADRLLLCGDVNRPDADGTRVDDGQTSLLCSFGLQQLA